MNLIIFGPPGIGKGSISSLIRQKYGIAHVSTGSIFRESKDPKINHYLESGLLVPDEEVMRVVEERLKQRDCKKGFILDGFPRTIKQAKFLKKKKIKIDIVLNLAADTGVITSRLSGRLICPKCEAIYHIKNIPPKKPGICDKCGAKLVQRKDDQPNVIKNRIEIYRKQTAGLIDYYKKEKLLVDIDGEKELNELFKDIAAVIERKV